MKTPILTLACLCLLPPSGISAETARVVRLWETPAVFKTPESVCLDAASGILYVSNIDGTDPWARDGLGSIGRMRTDGTVLAAEWVTGLEGPKGLGLHAGKLYAADLDAVVVIDVAAGRIVERIVVPGAVGLNDISIDPAGTVYVSDFKGGKIFAITGGRAAVFLDGLKTPNGVLAHGGDLLVLDKGAFLRVGADKQPKLVVDGLEGGTDGVEHVTGDTFLASCWGGTLYLVRGSEKHLLLDTREQKVNCADIGYDAAKRIVYVPTFRSHTVVAYQLELDAAAKR